MINTLISPVGFSLGKEPPYNDDAHRCDPHLGLVAIADGVTQSVFANEWAWILVDNFCTSLEPKICESIRDDWKGWIKPLQAQWMPTLEKARSKQSDPQIRKWNPLKSSKPRANTAAATFLGLKILPADAFGRGKWQCVAIGDSCLFHFRKVTEQYNLLEVFPLAQSNQFSSRTPCLLSNPKYIDKIVNEPIFLEGSYNFEDVFILATDALAQWLLKNREEGGKDWLKIFQVNQDEEFEMMVDHLRKANQIVYDDTTLLRINVGVIPQDDLNFPQKHINSTLLKLLTKYVFVKNIPSTDKLFQRTENKPKNHEKKVFEIPYPFKYVVFLFLLILIFIVLIYSMSPAMWKFIGTNLGRICIHISQEIQKPKK